MLDSAMKTACPKARILASPWMIAGTMTGDRPSVGSSSSSNFGPSASARDGHHLAFAAGERVAAARAVALELREHAVGLLDPRLGLPCPRMCPGRQRDV